MSPVQDAMQGKGEKKWWYGIAMMLMFCVFFLGMDFLMTGKITWSVWPVAAVIFFGVGFTLLNKFARE
jgi:membrane protein YdbS with pleckstrin-like domain